MKNPLVYLVLFALTLLQSCTSSDLVENWKNPEIDVFHAEKVLVLAMSKDVKNRRLFEKKLVDQLTSKGVNAVNSKDFFSDEFVSRPPTESELEALENELLSEGFDAILVSRVIGAEDKVTLVQSYQNFNRTFNDFEEDYSSSQDLYVEDERLEKYTVYHAESALYCICPTKEREVIWRGSIDVTQPDSDRKAIKDYINMLMWTLEEQKLLIITPNI
ncbi:MAG: hypothetical protein ACI828_000355 [Flavobacteriales bacterium]|jgi:hypothetical protein